MNKKCIYLIVSLLLFLSTRTKAQKQIVLFDSTQFENPQGINISSLSFRGLSVVNNKVIWASSSRGVVAKSIDGGEHFKLIQIAGYEKSEFRDIEAFNDDIAIVMSSGTPSYILKTYDGGESWKEVFASSDTLLFFDAIDFWNEDAGIVIGDPIDDRFVLYQTIDGGNTWHPLDTSMRPWAVAGESLFAASGTCFRCMPKKSIGFVTGGSQSVFHWLELDKRYQRFVLPNFKDNTSQGAFSFDYNSDFVIIVGGNYAQDSSKTKQAFFRYKYDKDGIQLMNFKPFYSGYRSCVTLLDKGDFITCGTSGVDVNNTTTTVTYHPEKTLISAESFHVVKKAKKGNLVVLAGSNGKIALLK
ncbi:MAG: oxidoreductase [Bacteroidia bacterium]|nr:oxidoreductase [Bacteroidia bacterium]